MKSATAGQRFVAFLVDTIILTIVTSLLSAFILLICHVKSPDMIKMPDDATKARICEYISKEVGLDSKTIDELDDTYFLIYTALLDESKYPDEVYIKEANEWFDEYSSYTLKSSITTIVVMTILFIAYYDILGYYWSKQTVGRMLMKIKVTDDSGKTPKITTLILRDFVGYELISILNICCCIPLIINIVLICGQGKASIGDKLSYTRMICYGNSNNDSFDNRIENEFNSFNQNDENIKDAEVVNDEENDK